MKLTIKIDTATASPATIRALQSILAELTAPVPADFPEDVWEPHLVDTERESVPVTYPFPADPSVELRPALGYPEPETPEHAPIKIEVGKTYVTHGGITMRITGRNDARKLAFEGICQYGPMYYNEVGETSDIVGAGWRIKSEVEDDSHLESLVEAMVPDAAPETAPEPAPAPAPAEDRSPLGFPDGLLERFPPLPEPPEGMRWKYEGQGDGRELMNIYAFSSSNGWNESATLSHSPSIHYAVAVPAVGF